MKVLTKKYGIYRKGTGYALGAFETPDEAQIFVDHLNNNLTNQFMRRNKVKREDALKVVVRWEVKELPTKEGSDAVQDMQSDHQ